MKTKQKTISLLTLVFLVLLSANFSYAQSANFHIYLCFGQSNMEGHSKFEPQDTIGDPRFQVMATVDCPTSSREKGQWYIATPPLTRCNTGLTPADYFGKTLVAQLPDSVQVGVINVAVGGCHIHLFDKDSTASYAAHAPDWMKGVLASYDNDPYKRLVDMGKIAQQKGIIKGILLHQGESNTGDTDWPNKVNKVYQNLLEDLNLRASETPLLAGELLSAEQGGKCASMNAIINTLPLTIPNAHIVSSEGCEGVPDGLHFSTKGYRALGNRYAEVMLDILMD
jgi:hypothetical protein